MWNCSPFLYALQSYDLVDLDWSDWFLFIWCQDLKRCSDHLPLHAHAHTHTLTPTPTPPPHPTGVSTLLCWGSSASDQATISWGVTQHKSNPRSSQGRDEPVCILLPQSFYGAVKSPRAALRGWGINQSELLEWTGNRKVLIVLYCSKTQCVVSSFHVR